MSAVVWQISCLISDEIHKTELTIFLLGDRFVTVQHFCLGIEGGWYGAELERSPYWNTFFSGHDDFGCFDNDAIDFRHLEDYINGDDDNTP